MLCGFAKAARNLFVISKKPILVEMALIASQLPTTLIISACVLILTVASTVKSVIIVQECHVWCMESVLKILNAHIVISVGVMQDLLVWIVTQTLMIVMGWIVTMEHGYICECNINYTGTHCNQLDYCAIYSADQSHGCVHGVCCANGGTCINDFIKREHKALGLGLYFRSVIII